MDDRRGDSHGRRADDRLKIDFPNIPQSDAARASQLFAGDLLVYEQVTAMRPLLTIAEVHLSRAFGKTDLRRAHQDLTPDAYSDRMRELHASCRSADDVPRAWADVFAEIGLAPYGTCYDWFDIRALPSGDSHLSRHTPMLPPHHDTWGSNIYQQINWWAPVFPVNATNSVVVFPRYWEKGIANSSADWDLGELRRLPPNLRRDYPRLPNILEKPKTAEPIALEPGDVLAFSAQHLHGSQPNTSPVARFNLECRTVCVADVDAHHTALQHGWRRTTRGLGLVQTDQRWHPVKGSS